MGWRNAGRQGHVVWRREGNPPGVCHYGNRWRDRYVLKTRMQAVKPLLAVSRPTRLVLDLGCGDGLWTDLLGRYGAQVVSSDMAPFGSAVNMLADAERLPFRDKTFDLTFVATVLAHVKDQQAAIDEMCRVSQDVLLVEFVAEPTPQWARDLPHRRVLTQTQLDVEMALRGFWWEGQEGCGALDQRLFQGPEWTWPAASIVTTAVDRLVREPARYRAVLYSRSA